MLYAVALFVVCVCFLALFYRHVRNGVFQKVWFGEKSFLSSDFVARLLWGGASVLSFALLRQEFRAVVLGLAFLLAQASIRVPHGYFMNMGRWAVPQKKWPSFVMPTLTQAEWNSLTIFERGCYDFGNGFCVGLWRGVISFAPLLAFGYGWAGVVSAVAVLALGTPLAYVAGNFTPWRLPNITPYSMEWGETYHGLVWAAAFQVLGVA